MAETHRTESCGTKRLIACCDGTWMNSDNGYNEPGLFNSKGTLQVPSNVTRISRLFKRRCSDGKLQIISYESGVGTGSNAIDAITGGAFGLGLSERVRETYSFLAANYMSGDEIFLVGYSRGAFTVRSVAGMVGSLGLLTREGVEHFYTIFQDMQHWMDDDYKDPFPNTPFSNKPKGPNAADEYRARLEKLGYTRVHQDNGELITIKGVCVWDTVGSLGIPRIAWLDKLGIRADNDEFKWHDTSLSDRIEHAFQALALDEARGPFSPAVWERLPENKLTTDLRQVWFPGNHANCGGGWADQGVANLTLAWMMDQMASVGVEFSSEPLERTLMQTAAYYTAYAAEWKKMDMKEVKFAIDPIFKENRPIRPWALGAIQAKSSLLYKLSGSVTRTPGLYRQADPKSGIENGKFLLDTNERIHSSVRVRLTCQGLGLNDKGTWKCRALKDWRLKQTDAEFHDPVPRHPEWEPEAAKDFTGDKIKRRWVWEFAGSERHAPTNPKQRTLVEEKLGPYERLVLKLAGGKPNVYEFAETKQ